MTSNRALRPEFTQQLATQLLAGCSLHLTSCHGQGRRRTLEDLRSALPDGVRVLQANLRDFPQHAELLIKELCSQSGHSGISAMSALLDTLQRDGTISVIILHNFDEMEQSDASGYNHHLFEALESIEKRSNIALLCVSETAAAFPLGSKERPLPALTGEQLAGELMQRNPDISHDELMQLIATLAGESAPYSALQNMVSPAAGKQ